MANKKYIKKNIYNDDFYLDTYDNKLEKLIYKYVIADEIVDNICDYNDYNYDIQEKYNKRLVSLKRVEKHINDTSKKQIKIIDTLNKLDEEMSDDKYFRIEKEQWMNKHKYTYYYEFLQVLNEIKDYVPYLIEGKSDFYKLQGYEMNPKLIKLDNKKYI